MTRLDELEEMLWEKRRASRASLVDDVSVLCSVALGMCAVGFIVLLAAILWGVSG